MVRSKRKSPTVFYGTHTGRAQQQEQQRVPFYSRGTSWLPTLALLIILGVGAYVAYLYQEAKKKGGGIKDVIKVDPDKGLVTDEYGRFTTSGIIIIVLLISLIIAVVYLLSYPEKRAALILWLKGLIPQKEDVHIIEDDVKPQVESVEGDFRKLTKQERDLYGKTKEGLNRVLKKKQKGTTWDLMFNETTNEPMWKDRFSPTAVGQWEM